MVFKKSFKTEKKAKQIAWVDLGPSIKHDDTFGIPIVHTYRPREDTPIIPNSPVDWIYTGNSVFPYLYIYQGDGSLQTLKIIISVIHNENTDKWNTDIALNPKSNGYNDLIVNLLRTGWEQHNIPFINTVLTDTELKNTVLYQVYAFEKQGDRLSTKDISEVIRILLTPTEDSNSDYVVVRNILNKLQKEGLISPFGLDAWYITNKGIAKFE